MGAVLQQAVGEAAGRCAGVEADEARRVDIEDRERVRQLVAAAADVGGTLDHLDRGGFGDEGARLRHRRAVHTHVAGHEDGPGAVTALDKAALDEQHVDAGSRRLRGLLGHARSIGTHR